MSGVFSSSRKSTMSDYRMQRMACARLPTLWGEFQLCLYANNQDNKEHLTLTMGDVRDRAGVLTRIHSECFTGDVLGSLRCDCGEQLERALQKIAEAGLGVIVYLRQEGRGIGLLSKLRAYNLQDAGYDTVDANLLLGHRADERDYTPAGLMLRDLDVRSVRLMTNNPTKLEALDALGVPVVERVPLQPTVHAGNQHYLDTKVRRLHHLLELPVSNGNGGHEHGNGNGNGQH
jgi:GTP cyclohydrolase II